MGKINVIRNALSCKGWKSILGKLQYISAFHLSCKEHTPVPLEVMCVMGTDRTQHPRSTLESRYNLLYLNVEQ